MKKYMVIDVGGTAIKYALMDEEFHFGERGELPTPQDGLEHYLDTLAGLVEPYRKEISGVAFSMPFPCLDRSTLPGAICFPADILLRSG